MDKDIQLCIDGLRYMQLPRDHGKVTQAFVGNKYFEKRYGAWVEVDFGTGNPVERV